MSAFTYRPKLNWNWAENMHKLDFIFSVSAAEIQQIRQVILITPAYTQLSNHQSHW